MTLGALIFLALVTGEVVALVKIGKQNERIEKLEKRIAKEK